MIKKSLSLALLGAITVGSFLVVNQAKAQYSPGVSALAAIASQLQELQKQINDVAGQIEELIIKARPVVGNGTLATSTIIKPVPIPLPTTPTPLPTIPVPAIPASGFITLEELPGNPTVSCALPTMRTGTQTNSVYLLQLVLKQAGYYPEGLITGYYGRLTTAAVSRFQTANGLTATGAVDEKTAAALNLIVPKYYPECGQVQPPPVETQGIVVKTPQSGEVVSSPLKVTGYVDSRAWVEFEGVLGKVVLLDAVGNQLASAALKVTPGTTYPCIAVPCPYAIGFSAVLEFTVPSVAGATNDTGVLVFSGAAAKDGSIPPEYRMKVRLLGPIVPLPAGNLPPVIDGVDGPNALSVNEFGTWTVKAHDPDSNYLSYSVNWGDESAGLEKPLTPPTLSSQAVTFTHSYANAGSYKIAFTVTDDKGASAQATRTVNVGVSGTINTPPNVFSFYGPTTLTVNQIGTWYGSFADKEGGSVTVEFCQGGNYLCRLESRTVKPDIELSISFQVSYGVAGTYYLSLRVTDSGGLSSALKTAVVVTSSGATNRPPVVSGVSGPSVLKVGENGTWTVTASDPEQGPLSYSVVWGDEYVYGGSGGVLAPTTQQTATFTHVYNNAGAYQPTFTVTDNGGLTAQTGITVVVGGSVTNAPSISSLYPTYGPIGTTVMITGSGFTPTGNSVNFDTGVIPNVPSWTIKTYLPSGNNGQAIVFSVPADRVPACAYTEPRCLLPAPYNPVTPGTYKVSVTNSNGTSNALTFTVQ